MSRIRNTVAGIMALFADEIARNPTVDSSGISPQMLVDVWSVAGKNAAHKYGRKPSGAARAKRIARKRRNIRARSAK